MSSTNPATEAGASGADGRRAPTLLDFAETRSNPVLIGLRDIDRSQHRNRRAPRCMGRRTLCSDTRALLYFPKRSACVPRDRHRPTIKNVDEISCENKCGGKGGLRCLATCLQGIRLDHSRSRSCSLLKGLGGKRTPPLPRFAGRGCNTSPTALARSPAHSRAPVGLVRLAFKRHRYRTFPRQSSVAEESC